ncbi:MAG: CHAT domain-containing protein [Blastocatellia bacterium]|nr:CHAT domain-containing protein [Blastocatellia bacterium]
MRQVPSTPHTESKPYAALIAVALQVSVFAITIQAFTPALPGEKNSFPYGRATDTTRQRETVYQLVPGESLQQEIVAGSRHIYPIKLSAGQYLRATINKTETNLRVILHYPGRRKPFEINRRRYEPTHVSLIATVTGVYRLEVLSPEENKHDGRYELSLEPARKATARDRKSLAAEQACARADILRAEWKATSLRKAITLYEGSLSVWRSIDDRLGEASALINIGDTYSTMGENRKSLDYFERGLSLSRAIGDQLLEIESLNRLGYAYIDLNDREKPISYLNEALLLSRETGFIRGEAESLNNIGLAYYVRGNMVQALEYCNRALALWQTTTDSRGRAETLMNLGYTNGDLGDKRKALSLYKEALALWRQVKDRRGEALALTAMGGVYSVLGDKQEALKLHNDALHIFRALGDKHSEAAACNGMGYAYDDLGDKQNALTYYERALRLYRVAGDRNYEALTMGYIGRVHFALGAPEKALDYFNRKLEIIRDLVEPRMEAYTLRDIGVVFDFLGYKDNALDHYDRALSLSRSARDPRGQANALNSIGHIYDRRGEKQKALSLYNEALTLIRAVEDRRGETLALHNIARANRDLGNLAEARDHIEPLLKIVESLRTKVVGQELRSSYFASVRQHYELYIDVLMQLHKQNPSDGFAAAAFDASERSRARSLLDLLTEARVRFREGVDPLLLERETALKQVLDAKTERQTRMLSRETDVQQLAAVREEIAELTTQYEEVRAEIKTRSPRYAALTQPRMLTISEVRGQVLDSDTLLLEYSIGEERSYLFAVTRTSTDAFELPGRVELERLARRLYELLTRPGRDRQGETRRQRQSRIEKAAAAYEVEAARLSRLLLGPVASELGSRRLVIVADDALNYIPFAALPDPNGGRNPQPLMVEHEIVNLSSASSLAALRMEIKDRAPAPKTIAVFADPVFERDDSRMKIQNKRPGRKSVPQRAVNGPAGKPGDPDEALRFQRLPSARQEADNIKALVPERERFIALSFDANRERVINEDLKPYRIIHFAAHGVLNTDNPDSSCIVLSTVDERGRSQNGFLKLHEIYNLTLSADVVVLSACETGLGKEIRGEGLVGLTRGFLYAGSAGVVASLWTIDDNASAELMKYFYEGMLGKERLRPAAALRAAQVAMWKQERWRSPYYWAAFTLHGEWAGRNDER